jgi:hypothetical protein
MTLSGGPSRQRQPMRRGWVWPAAVSKAVAGGLLPVRLAAAGDLGEHDGARPTHGAARDPSALVAPTESVD